MYASCVTALHLFGRVWFTERGVSDCRWCQWLYTCRVHETPEGQLLRFAELMRHYRGVCFFGLSRDLRQLIAIHEVLSQDLRQLIASYEQSFDESITIVQESGKKWAVTLRWF